jgi:hypothetical protein
LVYSKPDKSVPADRLQKLLQDPRYLLQQELRAAAAAHPSLPEPGAVSVSALDDDDAVPDVVAPAAAPASGPLPRGLMKALIPPPIEQADAALAKPKPTPKPTPKPPKKNRIKKDWSVGEGTNGTTGVGQFPATFTQTGSGGSLSCGTDIAIYNTGLGGSSSQATVVAYNNIYASCNGGVPTVYYAYNTGTAAVATSVALSPNGTQLALIQGNSGSAASLVVVTTSNSGGSVSSPTTPTETTVAFSNSHSDTYSSPFYDSSSDTVYVGDDLGVLHKFSPVFLGTPAEVTTGGWPVQVSSATLGGALGSPVYDSNTSLVFVGDYLLNYASTCEPSATNSPGSCGYLYSVSSSGTVVQSHQLDYQYGIVDSPIVDVTTGQVFAFVGADNTTACSSGPCAGVFGFPETFASGATGTEAQVGAGYEFLLSGAFDNNYFTTGTGNLYVVGGTGPQNNTLYGVGISSGTISGTVTTGPIVASNYTNGYYAGGLQVTEFYTGTHDYIFTGVLMYTTNSLVGEVSGYDVTTPPISPSTAPTGTIAAQGGPSGIVIDNAAAGAQNIYYSTTLNSTCTTSGSGGCAVQVIQSAP